MDSKEHYFIKNYSFFGQSSARRYKYKPQDITAIKKKQKEKGNYMLPVRKVTKDKMPVKNGRKMQNHFSTIGFAVACLDYDDQNKLIELSKNVPDPNILIDEAIALQVSRIGRGYQAEQEQGRLLDSTEAAIQNYVNMIQAKKNIDDGQDINVNVTNTISSLLDEIDKDNKGSGDLDFNYDEESKKEELRKVRTNTITDILDDMK